MKFAAQMDFVFVKNVIWQSKQFHKLSGNISNRTQSINVIALMPTAKL